MGVAPTFPSRSAAPTLPEELLAPRADEAEADFAELLAGREFEHGEHRFERAPHARPEASSERETRWEPRADEPEPTSERTTASEPRADRSHESARPLQAEPHQTPDRASPALDANEEAARSTDRSSDEVGRTAVANTAQEGGPRAVEPSGGEQAGTPATREAETAANATTAHLPSEEPDASESASEQAEDGSGGAVELTSDLSTDPATEEAAVQTPEELPEAAAKAAVPTGEVEEEPSAGEAGEVPDPELTQEAASEDVPDVGEADRREPTAAKADVVRASEIPASRVVPTDRFPTTPNPVASNGPTTLVQAAAATASLGTGAQGQSGEGGQAPSDGGAGGRSATGAAAAVAGSTTTAARSAVTTATIFPEGESTGPSWVERISERIRLTRGADRVELRLELTPKGLGQIDVRLRMDGEGLHATIVAEHEQTRALLAHQQHRLEAALEQEDLHLAGFDLGLEDDADGEPAARDERRASGTPGQAAAASTTDTGEGAVAHPAQPSLGDGRVSYWA